MSYKIGLSIPILTMKVYMARRLNVFMESFERVTFFLLNLEVNRKSCYPVV